MKLRVILLVILVILTLTAAQYGLAATSSGDNSATTGAAVVSIAVTTTPTPESSTGDSATEHDQAVATSQPGQAFQVAVATYLMDTAGFHDLDERLNQDGAIEAGDAGMVNRVNQLLGATEWPADLQAQVDPLKETLSQYAEALANDDLEAAKPLATQTHELQHDLSHAVETWLAGANGAGEHGMEEEHDHSEEHSEEQGG
jgi:hypothetical protein